jgi:pimeloyl-ACP methyl ester carboxylesterase
MKRILRKLAVIVLLAVMAVGVVVWVGSYASLDRDFTHTQLTKALEAFEPARSTGAMPVLSRIESGRLAFRARTAGFGGRQGDVILLHGFPESSAMYEPMIPVLALAGYQVVAFDQRGYSPGARPAEAEQYTIDKLVGDVRAVADAVGFDTFHLVGHDWGAAVGWQMVFQRSPRVSSWAALSIPHLGAYTEAILTDPDQQSRSRYIGFFRTRWLPETVFTFNGLAMMRSVMYATHRDEIVAEYVSIFSEPGALTAALNWYRASELTAGVGNNEVSIPTAFIWGNQDPVVGDRSVEAQNGYFEGNLTVTELDTGHWLMESEADAVTRAVLKHVNAH